MTASASVPVPIQPPHAADGAAATAGRRLPLVQGPTLRCIERGPAGAAETVLLLHGYSDSGRSWAPVIGALPPAWHVLAPDQRGHGDSDRPADGYGIAQLAADAAALLDAAGVRRATVVGHSMGSMVAQQLALDHPGRVARLVLVGATPHPRGEPVRALLGEVQALTDPVSETFIREFQRSTLYRAIPEAFFEQAVAESRKLPARVWRALADAIAAFDVRTRLHRIACPTLVVWGARETIFLRPEQEEILAALPRAAFLEYEDAGHALHWEEPERFARDLAAFVARTRAAEPTKRA